MPKIQMLMGFLAAILHQTQFCWWKKPLWMVKSDFVRKVNPTVVTSSCCINLSIFELFFEKIIEQSQISMTFFLCPMWKTGPCEKPQPTRPSFGLLLSQMMSYGTATTHPAGFGVTMWLGNTRGEGVAYTGDTKTDGTFGIEPAVICPFWIILALLTENPC